MCLCSYCGVAWHRSRLFRDASGNLCCPDDAGGLDVVTLSLGNAEAASNRQLGRYSSVVDGTFETPNTVPSPGFVDPNGPPPSLQNTGPTGSLSVLTNQWLRGDRVELVGGSVQRWTDQSNRGNEPYALAAVNRPGWLESDPTLLGNPVVVGAGGNKWFRLVPSFSGARPMWMWMIACLDGAGSNLLNYGPRLVANSTPGTLLFINNTGVSADNAGAAIGSWFRAIFSFNLVGTDSLLVKSTIVTLPSGGSRVVSAPELLSTSNGLAPFVGRVAELLVTEGPPSATEIAAIEAYGVARYGAGVFT